MKPSTRILLMQKRLLTPIFLGSRLALWLDAADRGTVTLDGSTASEWRDKSGNGYHASQPNKASQPTYNPTGLNGSPVLTFDGVNDFFTTGTNSSFNFLHNGQESSVFIVAKAGRTVQSQENSFVSTSARSTLVGVMVGFTDKYRALVTCGVAGSFVVNVSTNLAVVLNQWNIIRYGLDADAIPVNRSIVNINNGEDMRNNVANNAPSLSNSTHPLYIGNDPELVLPFLGEMAEILIINGRISAYEQQQITGYFAHKRGLIANLPNNHPFKFRPPYM